MANKQTGGQKAPPPPLKRGEVHTMTAPRAAPVPAKGSPTATKPGQPVRPDENRSGFAGITSVPASGKMATQPGGGTGAPAAGRALNDAELKAIARAALKREASDAELKEASTYARTGHTEPHWWVSKTGIAAAIDRAMGRVNGKVPPPAVITPPAPGGSTPPPPAASATTKPGGSPAGSPAGTTPAAPGQVAASRLPGWLTGIIGRGGSINLPGFSLSWGQQSVVTKVLTLAGVAAVVWYLFLRKGR
jgi:hypothetical protein